MRDSGLYRRSRIEGVPEISTSPTVRNVHKDCQSKPFRGLDTTSTRIPHIDGHRYLRMYYKTYKTLTHTHTHTNIDVCEHNKPKETDRDMYLCITRHINTHRPPVSQRNKRARREEGDRLGMDVGVARRDDAAWTRFLPVPPMHGGGG